MVAIVAEILHLQALDGSHACAGVGQCPDHGAIAEADGVRAVDGREEAARLLHGDRGRLALQGGGAPWPADGEEGIEGDGVARDQEVEEMAERGERLLLRRGAAVEVVDEAGGVPWSDLPELELPGFAPDEEPSDDAAVRTPRVRIRDGGGEFVGGEPAARPGPLDDGRPACVHRARQGKHPGGRTDASENVGHVSIMPFIIDSPSSKISE